MRSDLRDRPKSPPTPPTVRLRAERANVRVLAALAAIAVVVAAAYLWVARPRPEPPPPAAVSGASAPAASLAPASDSPNLSGPSALPAASGAPVTSGTQATVVVHVLGKVRRPGVISLPAGSRIAEAIKAAGGVRPGAGTGTLNLARKVEDGEQIPVGIRPPPPAPGQPAPGAPGSSPGVPGGPSGTPLDLNTASADQLDGLPGVGPVLARRIVDYRTQHGGFRSVEQLQEVDGIGARRFADLRPMVRV